MSKKFVDVMNDYNECQVTYRQKCKERIQRQLTITGRDTTDEEIEEMIETGNPQIFSHGVSLSLTLVYKSGRSVWDSLIWLEWQIRQRLVCRL